MSFAREDGLVRSYLAGDTAADLAKQYGMYRTSVKQTIHRRGARKRGHALPGATGKAVKVQNHSASQRLTAHSTALEDGLGAASEF